MRMKLEFLPNDHQDSESPCCICGKKVDKPKYWLRLVNGGNEVATEDEIELDASDLGWHPIGIGCLKKHPELKSFVVRTKS